MLAGAAGIGLALTNLPLLVLSIASLALVPVPFLGMALVPWTTNLVRKRTDLERRLASRAGVPVARPYHPPPERGVPGGWRRFRWTLTDPATWRDLAWLVPGAVVGIAVGAIVVAIPLYGLAGLTLTPVWIWMGTDWYGYGTVWSVDTFGEAVLCVPQGAAILAGGLWVAPWLRRVDASFDRLLLAPTRAAELRLRVTQLTVTRADTVDAQAAELRRIERDLHDGIQARLVSLGMMIGLADELIDRNPAAAHEMLAEARKSSGTALVELRHLVRGIHPPVLAERGLVGAVRALALSLPVPITVDADLSGRLDTPVESAAYFAVAETLTNVVRHSRAQHAWVSLCHDAGRLAMVVTDDGAGGADSAAGTGLRGIERRLAAFDGTMTLSSPPGGPTVITMELPCALSSPRTTHSFATD
ncbi:Signal transduction histidine kinase [Micromonospora phaseoli]|uniref:histidine kinase n=1 Tax=Micromonospora phaseoli TaxID=1144548 RepID=A0A1H7DUP3_9ACTN|nr:signal transduction histidine kinase [Micromonospora phaseoli]GIJ80561.1 histidine kinase [Micromonospora phaseoli]SEK05471.1 Signal transduction histidine kinase [Micromonospora phaseoli]